MDITKEYFEYKDERIEPKYSTREYFVCIDSFTRDIPKESLWNYRISFNSSQDEIQYTAVFENSRLNPFTNAENVHGFTHNGIYFPPYNYFTTRESGENKGSVPVNIKGNPGINIPKSFKNVQHLTIHSMDIPLKFFEIVNQFKHILEISIDELTAYGNVGCEHNKDVSLILEPYDKTNAAVRYRAINSVYFEAGFDIKSLTMNILNFNKLGESIDVDVFLISDMINDGGKLKLVFESELPKEFGVNDVVYIAPHKASLPDSTITVTIDESFGSDSFSKLALLKLDGTVLYSSTNLSSLLIPFKNQNEYPYIVTIYSDTEIHYAVIFEDENSVNVSATSTLAFEYAKSIKDVRRSVITDYSIAADDMTILHLITLLNTIITTNPLKKMYITNFLGTYLKENVYQNTTEYLNNLICAFITKHKIVCDTEAFAVHVTHFLSQVSASSLQALRTWNVETDHEEFIPTYVKSIEYGYPAHIKETHTIKVFGIPDVETILNDIILASPRDIAIEVQEKGFINDSTTLLESDYVRRKISINSHFPYSEYEVKWNEFTRLQLKTLLVVRECLRMLVYPNTEHELMSDAFCVNALNLTKTTFESLYSAGYVPNTHSSYMTHSEYVQTEDYIHYETNDYGNVVLKFGDSIPGDFHAVQSSLPTTDITTQLVLNDIRITDTVQVEYEIFSYGATTQITEIIVGNEVKKFHTIHETKKPGKYTYSIRIDDIDLSCIAELLVDVTYQFESFSKSKQRVRFQRGDCIAKWNPCWTHMMEQFEKVTFISEPIEETPSNIEENFIQGIIHKPQGIINKSLEIIEIDETRKEMKLDYTVDGDLNYTKNSSILINKSLQTTIVFRIHDKRAEISVQDVA